jgi:hydroxypyruvate isomerase
MSHTFSRRTAFRKLAAGAALMGAASSMRDQLLGAETPGAAGLKGRINQSVCRWCYGKVSLEDLCKAAKAMGIKSVELLEAQDFPVLKQYELACAMVSGVPGGIANGLNRLENHDKIVRFFENAIPVVANAGHPSIICFSGNRAGMDDEKGLENCAIGLKRIAPLAEQHKVNVVMELLNSKIDHKDYMCDHTAWGVALCKRVSSDRVKLLYDIYHMQIMEGDVIRTIKGDKAKGIEAAAPYIAHYHTGGVPGRHEIDESQELNYPAIMRAIADTGFKGFVGQEFIPAGPDALASLRKAVQLCDV